MKYLLLVAILFPFLLAHSQDSVIAPHDTVTFSHLSFKEFKQHAQFENKPYFIMFGASWCAPCHRIRSELFTNTQIAALANQNYLAYYIDLENFDDVEVNSRYFKVSQLPTVLFFDPMGKQTDKAIGVFDGYYFFRKLRTHIPPAQWGPDWIGEGTEE